MSFSFTIHLASKSQNLDSISLLRLHTQNLWLRYKELITEKFEITQKQTSKKWEVQIQQLKDVKRHKYGQSLQWKQFEKRPP